MQVQPDKNGLIRFAFDPVTKRPGCVLLQVAFGASEGVGRHFSSEIWQIEVGHLRLYSCTPEQWPSVVKEINSKSPKR